MVSVSKKHTYGHVAAMDWEERVIRSNPRVEFDLAMIGRDQGLRIDENKHNSHGLPTWQSVSSPPHTSYK